MAGLSNKERRQIEVTNWQRIARYLETRRWEWILVLTISDDPITRMQRMSNKTLITAAYPDFIRAIQTQVKVTPEDFWAAERGQESGRINVNVLLALKKIVSAKYLASLWYRISGSHAEVYEYDPERGVAYWMKDLVRFEADILDYGGSAIGLPSFGAEHERTRPFRRSHYAKQGGYRPQPGAYIHQGETTAQNGRCSSEIEKLILARQQRESQRVA